MQKKENEIYFSIFNFMILFPDSYLLLTNCQWLFEMFINVELNWDIKLIYFFKIRKLNYHSHLKITKKGEKARDEAEAQR